jgi:hypothetical protein
MDNLLNSRIRLEIHEPWEKSEILHGNIIKISDNLSDLFFLVKIDNNNGLFMVSERYVEEKLSYISTTKKIHIAIGYFDKPEEHLDGDINKFKYYGRGGIVLDKEN